jgi:sigma-B regulation protein RsbU (phosphoserine phosphatase)
MIAAKEVGGDFYDFYKLNENTVAFLVADVSGKGIPAAMFMMNAKSTIKRYAERGLEVHEILEEANNALCEGNEAEMFVTAWMGILNLETGLLTFGNAGHNPPLLRHKDGTFEYLRSKPNLALAMMDGVPYKKHEIQLNPGDMLYLYTDGVTEATNAQIELFGEARLQDALNEKEDATAEDRCKRILADIDAFVGEAEQFDDITMLSVNYYGAENMK